MPTYYVRTDGSDSNAGTSSGTGGAWQTIGKALGASGISSGDTVHVMAGVYREVVTVAMTSATAETSVIGDVDGSVFGTSGRVVWTAYLTSDTGSPSSSATLNLSGRDYLTFENFVIVGGSFGSGSCIAMGTQTSTNCTFRNVHCRSGSWSQVYAQCNFGDTMALLFDRCTFRARKGAFNSNLGSGTGSDYDVGITFESCMFTGGGTDYCINFSSGGAGANRPGGCLVNNCTFNGVYIGVRTGTWATSDPCVIKNCYFADCATCISAGVSGEITEDYNGFSTGGTLRQNVTAGTNSLSGSAADDLGESLAFGLDQEIIAWPISSGWLDGAGTDTGMPTTDLYGNTFATPHSIGAVEVGDAFPAAGGGLIVHPGMSGGMRG